jgi:hypothetical protein
MKKLALFALIVISMASCAHKQSGEDENPDEVGAPVLPGDEIKYRYSGSYRKEPIFLTEKVLEVKDGEVTSLLTWVSGKETRTWKQIAKETLDSKREGRVEKVIEIRNGKETILTNMNNRDLYRLYEGTFLRIEEGPGRGAKKSVDFETCNRKFPAREESGTQKIGKNTYQYKITNSAQFPWYRLNAQFWDADKEPYFTAEIVDCKLHLEPVPRPTPAAVSSPTPVPSSSPLSGTSPEAAPTPDPISTPIPTPSPTP